MSVFPHAPVVSDASFDQSTPDAAQESETHAGDAG